MSRVNYEKTGGRVTSGVEEKKARWWHTQARTLQAVERLFCGLRMYQRPLGIRGMWAYCGCRFGGSPARLTVRTPRLRRPVTLRMRTTDVSIYEDVLLRGQYDLPLPFVPQTIMDLGANIGMASVYFANRYPNAQIVAVEAEASNFEMLLLNTSQYPKIRPIHAAVWNRDGNIALSSPREGYHLTDKLGFAVIDGDNTPIRAVTMRTLMNEVRMPSIDLLKVDIEGAEKEIFESAPDWICKVRGLAIELHDRFKPGCWQAVRAATTGKFNESHKGEVTIYVRDSDPMDVGHDFDSARRDQYYGMGKADKSPGT